MLTPEQVKNIFSDSYKLYLSAHAMSDTEQNWEAAITEARRICGKYSRCDLAERMTSLALTQVRMEKEYGKSNQSV